MKKAEFEEFAGNYPMPGGLEYVAAAYERLGAEKDSTDNFNDDGLYAYYEAAYGEEFWLYKAIENKL